jgi:hypothetical protein
LKWLILTIDEAFLRRDAVYLDAKIDSIGSDVKRLIDYMILHEGKFAVLEEKTKKCVRKLV